VVPQGFLELRDFLAKMYVNTQIIMKSVHQHLRSRKKKTAYDLKKEKNKFHFNLDVFFVEKSYKVH